MPSAVGDVTVGAKPARAAQSVNFSIPSAKAEIPANTNVNRTTQGTNFRR